MAPTPCRPGISFLAPAASLLLRRATGDNALRTSPAPQLGRTDCPSLFPPADPCLPRGCAPPQKKRKYPAHRRKLRSGAGEGFRGIVCGWAQEAQQAAATSEPGRMPGENERKAFPGPERFTADRCRRVTIKQEEFSIPLKFDGNQKKKRNRRGRDGSGEPGRVFSHNGYRSLSPPAITPPSPVTLPSGNNHLL